MASKLFGDRKFLFRLAVIMRDNYFLCFNQSIPDESGVEKSGLDLYFLDREGKNFKASILYEPYFYVDIGSHWSRVNEVACFSLSSVFT